MGFGHAIYRTSDPRNVIIKAWSEKLAEENGDTSLYDISVACEEFMWDTKKNYSVMPTFSMRLHTTIWVYQLSYLPLFLFAHV